MRRFKLNFHPTITFLVTVLTTVYVCNLTIAFKRSFPPDATEFDPLASFRVGGETKVRARSVEVRPRDQTEGESFETNVSDGSGSINIVPAQAGIQEESEEGDQSHPKEADWSNGDEESEENGAETDGNSDKDMDEEAPLKAQVVPLLRNTIKKSPRSKEWWRRKKEGTQRRNDEAMAYVAETQNITLPSSLRERAPAFILIGAQKSGTTALRTYLSKHPLIEVPIDVGETHFFDKHFPQGASDEELLDAYVEQFFDRDCRLNESHCIAGESTPIYLFDTEHVPARVKSVCPWTKFIVLLRDPVQRAISHCNMLIERSEIQDTFEMRLERDFKWMMQKGLISNTTSFSHQDELEAWRRYSNTEPAKTRWKKLPIGRGFYELQLRRWFQYFPREQFLILKSEDLDTDRAETMKRVFDFLGVPNHVAKKHDKKIHQRTYSFQAANDVSDFLYDFYRPYNEKLADLLGPEWQGVWENPKVVARG